MIYTKAFSESKIPTFVLDVSQLFEKYRETEVFRGVNNYESMVYDLNVFEYTKNLINIYDVNNEAVKFIGLNWKIYSIEDVYKKNNFVEYTVNSILDIINSDYKIIECNHSECTDDKLHKIFCYKIFFENNCYIFCHILNEKNKHIDDSYFYTFVEKYYLLLASIEDAVVVVDVNQNLIVEYNHHAKSLLNIDDNDKFIYHYHFFDNEFKEKYLKFYENILNGIENDSKEFAIKVNKKSIPVKVKITISIINGLKVAQIIFTDLRSKYKLENRRNMLAAAVDQVAESVIVTNSIGEIEYVNSAYENISGKSFDEVSGKILNILKGDGKNTWHNKIMWDDISNGRVWRGNFTDKKKNGDMYCEDVTISPVKDSMGDIVNYVAVKRDVTQHLLLENQVRQSQKMHAIGVLAGGIAHDFNNILTSILGFAELCKIQCDENSIIHSNINEIIQASLRAGELVDQILKFSRSKNKEISKFNVSGVLIEVVRLIKATIHPGIEIVLNVINDTEIRGDQTQLHQVLMNLCTNAYQSIVTEKGVIKISLFDVMLSPQQAIAIGRLSPGKYVCIQLKDNGIGIPKEYIHRIFDPYFTTKKLNEGTGLGLSVVHGIVNDHRGAITVESEVGAGSCFSVYLPEAVNDSEL